MEVQNLNAGNICAIQWVQKVDVRNEEDILRAVDVINKRDDLRRSGASGGRTVDFECTMRSADSSEDVCESPEFDDRRDTAVILES
jgi:hypothetical protein